MRRRNAWSGSDPLHSRYRSRYYANVARFYLGRRGLVLTAPQQSHKTYADTRA
jgi:hypothetical protein